MTQVYEWHVSVEETDRALQTMGDTTQRRHGYSHPTQQIRAMLANGEEQKLYDAAANGMTKVLQRTENKERDVTKAIDHLQSEIGKVVDDEQRKTPQGIALAAEIRAHLKGMPPKERSTFLRDAIASGDRITVAAALKAPAFLIGLKEEESNGFYHQAAHAWAPQHKAQLDALTKVLPKVQQARQSLMERMMRLEATLGKAAQARQHASSKLNKLANGGR